jgi:lysozyme
MQLSFNGLEAIKEHEGFKANAYKDVAGVWTIGYGTIKINGKPVQEGMTCTVAEATEYMRQDLAWAQTAINKLVKVPLKQNQFDALVSFIYNIGENAFGKSTMLRLLNSGDYSGAAAQFDRWNRAGGKVVKGLVARRKVERSLFEA